MATGNKKVINSYLREVSSNLYCKKSLKSVFIQELKSDIENYTDSSVLVKKEDLYHEFGTPEEIANSLFDRNDYNLLLKRAKIKVFVCILIATVLFILLLVSGYVIIELFDLIIFEVTVTNVY